MMDRMQPVPTYPVKNQETAITFRGKTYAICSQEQMTFMLDQARNEIISVANVAKEKLPEEEIGKRLNLFKEGCGFATLDYVLSLMTPAEQQEWKDKYRFCPITRPIKR